MNKIKYFAFLIGIIAILVFGYKLRLHDYSKIPFPGESTDEYSNSWVGLSLIEFGMPIGITNLSGYKTDYFRYVNVDRIHQSMVSSGPLLFHRPWFDHPPTMGLLTGGFAYFKGVRNFEDANTSTIRKPMVLLGTVSVLLVSVLAYLIAGPWVSLLSGVIYATSPILVINSRMIQAENGYLPLFLLTLICLLLFEKREREYWLWLAGMFSALSITMKVPGSVAALAGITLLMTQDGKSVIQKIKESVLFAVISILGLLSFIVYGAALDWTTFTNVFLANSNRPYDIGYNAINDLIIYTKVTSVKNLTDGWPLLGWLSLWMIKPEKRSYLYRYLVLPVLVYLVIYLLAGSLPYGWYRIPFMPFLYISLSVLITGAFENKNKTIAAVFGLLLPLGVNLQKITNINNNQDLLKMWKLGILGLSIVVLTSLIFQNEKYGNKRIVSKIVLLVLIALAIYTNFRYNSLITVDYWYKSS